VKLTLGGTTYEGRVVDLRGRDVDGDAVAAAVRNQRCLPALDTPPAPPVYAYCGYVHPEMGLRTRTALAAAARSRGHETDHDDTIEELREQLATLEAIPGPTPPDPFEAPPVVATLAVLRLARTDVPVVLEVDRFRTPTAAADVLDAPVIRG